MARKKSVSNQSARREEIVDYDVKRLRQMSAKELQDYYDRVEPLSDDEVNAIYDRVMPKIAYEIASNNQQKKPRHIGSSIKKTVLVAVCMTLMLSVVAQALGIPVWETIYSWTQEHLLISIFHTKNSALSTESIRYEFSSGEKQVWGDDICKAFEELDFYPPLPQWRPDNLSVDDLFYMKDDIGGIYVHALFSDIADHTFTFEVEKIANHQSDVSYDLALERDLAESQIINIDGLQYYHVTNLGSHSIVWLYDDILYSVFTTYDFDIAWDIIQSIHYNEGRNVYA